MALSPVLTPLRPRPRAGARASDSTRTPSPRRGSSLRFEIAVAALGFAALCVIVLTKAPQLLEPDDSAYRASIVALEQGHVVLTTAQYRALADLLGSGGSGIAQWVHLPSGLWISQKNPGYPFFAVVFQILGALRAAPLFSPPVSQFPGCVPPGAECWGSEPAG